MERLPIDIFFELIVNYDVDIVNILLNHNLLNIVKSHLNIIARNANNITIKETYIFNKIYSCELIIHNLPSNIKFLKNKFKLIRNDYIVFASQDNLFLIPIINGMCRNFLRRIIVPTYSFVCSIEYLYLAYYFDFTENYLFFLQHILNYIVNPNNNLLGDIHMSCRNVNALFSLSNTKKLNKNIYYEHIFTTFINLVD